MMKVLQFLNLTDDQGRLSVTNLAVFIALFKLATTQTSPMDMGVLFTSLLNYAHRRHVNAQQDNEQAVEEQPK